MEAAPEPGGAAANADGECSGSGSEGAEEPDEDEEEDGAVDLDALREDIARLKPLHTSAFRAEKKEVLRSTCEWASSQASAAAAQGGEGLLYDGEEGRARFASRYPKDPPEWDSVADAPVGDVAKTVVTATTGTNFQMARATGMQAAPYAPRYTAWIGLRSNFRIDETDEDEIPLFIPSFGDNASQQELEATRQYAEVANVKQPVNAVADRIFKDIMPKHGKGATVRREISDALKIDKKYLVERLDRLATTQQSEQQQARNRSATASERCNDYRQLFCRRCYVFDCRDHGCGQPFPADRVQKAVCIKSTEQSVKGLEQELREDQRREAEKAAAAKESESQGAAAAVGGSGAGGNGSGSGRPLPPPEPAAANLKAKPAHWKRVPVEEPKAEVHKVACSAGEDCCLNRLVSGEGELLKEKVRRPAAPGASDGSVWWPAPPAGPALSDMEETLITRLRKVVGESPCQIARIIRTVSCRQVMERMQAEPPDSAQAKQGNSVHQHEQRQRQIAMQRRRNYYKHSKAAETDVPEAERPEYFPCDHDGACTAANCSCVQNHLLCEKYCVCSVECRNRAQGCACKKNQCQTRACPCYASQRECDPDLCHSCSACVPAGTGHLSEELGRRCKNVGVQEGNHVHLLLAPSVVHGYGAFVKNAVQKGQLIHEYLGETISQAEAERRGRVYDLQKSSFLFNLSQTTVVDATRKGNKTKFINHASLGSKGNIQANVEVRYVMARGSRHICLYARRDIAAKEELFFDYNYTEEAAPQWAEQRKKRSLKPAVPAEDRRTKRKGAVHSPPASRGSPSPRQQSASPRPRIKSADPRQQRPAPPPEHATGWAAPPASDGWTAEEEAQLRQLVQADGPTDWGIKASKLKGRFGGPLRSGNALYQKYQESLNGN